MTTSLWIDLLGAQVRYYDAAGVRTRSIEYGSGTPVVLLHGVGGHAEAFARNVVPLGATFDARAIDYYGHGLTDFGAVPYSKVAFVQHLIDYLDAAGIERAHFVGESLGGWIACWLAIEHPERVGKIVYTVGAHLSVPIDDATRERTEAGMSELKRLSMQFAANPTRENVRARLNWLFHRANLAKPSVAPIIGKTDALLTPERLAQIPAPMLFLWTDHNPSQQVATAKQAMTYVKDAEFALMEDCGHWPQWEHPDTFNRIVRDYLVR
jgi:pimeloyl-ACP methyl ester carboxylesterase